MTFWQVLSTWDFWLLAATALAGILGGSPWVFLPLCVAGLSAAEMQIWIDLWQRTGKAGALRDWIVAIGRWLLSATGAAAAAFLLGAFARWLWS